MKWPYVIQMPLTGKSGGKNDGQYSITVRRFLNVVPFIRGMAIVLFNFTTNE